MSAAATALGYSAKRGDCALSYFMALGMVCEAKKIRRVGRLSTAAELGAAIGTRRDLLGHGYSLI